MYAALRNVQVVARRYVHPVPDREWNIRTGRATDILAQTLPDFFQRGLVHEDIYSPAIRLTYTPPVPLPPPLPTTLSLEGLPLYLASSMLVRHTMKTVYADLRVELRKLAVETPHAREKSVLVGLSVFGTTRVSGAPGEWQIECTYTFSSLTGLIHRHAVDAIHPRPIVFFSVK